MRLHQACPAHTMHVVELARTTGVTPAAVRYYTRIGLLTPARDSDNGYRSFSSEDAHRVRFIRQAQRLGLTIIEIKQVLGLVEDGRVPCDHVESLVEGHLGAIDAEIQRLCKTRLGIARALDAWRSAPRPERHDGEYCPLIERLPSDLKTRESDSAPLRLRSGAH